MVDAERDQPDRGCRRRGSLLLGLRRQALPRLRVAARQRLDRPRPPEGRGGDQGAGRDSSRRSARRWRPSRAPASESCSPKSLRATSTMSFFTNGGAEANENAIKLARWYTGRHKVIARYRSYHGATAGAISLTGDPRRWPTEPGLPGIVRMLDPYTYRCPAGHPDPCPVCSGAPHLEEILMYEGAHTVAAVILETVTGTNGIIVPPGRLPPVDPRGLRPARDPADRRRGNGRVRPHGQVVRGRQLERRARHHHAGQGNQLRLRPARRDGHPPPDRRLGAVAVLRRRAHLLGPSTRLRVRRGLDRGLPGGGDRRERSRDGRCLPRRTGEARREASVDRRRARARLLLGPRARQESRDARAARAVQRLRRGRQAGPRDDQARAHERPLPDDALEHGHALPPADDHAG